MEEKAFFSLRVLLVVFLFFSLLLSSCSSNPVNTINPVNDNSTNDSFGSDSLVKNFCSPESRNADFCIEVYDPVCGWFSQDVKCVRYPCAQDFSNSCFACLNEQVDYWTPGPCPK